MKNLVVFVVFSAAQLSVLGQQAPPEIVDEVIPEMMSQARLNCTVVNKQPTNVVMWLKLPNIISLDEKINVDKSCVDGSKKYEIIRSEVDGRVTYMLVIHCLDDDDYGIYKCYISIMGDSMPNWPVKTGYLSKL